MKTKLFLNVFMAFAMCAATTASAQVTSKWFKISEVGPKVWLLEDHGADNIYLVEGSKKAMIVDTGLGAADLAGVAKKITDKPLVVVNTHGHPDHSGGNYQFETIYMGGADIVAAKMFSSAQQREGAGAAMLQGQKPDEDEQYKGIIHEPEYVAVTDGQVIDLGDREMEVMFTPGHTPGGICLLDKKNKLLFSGDNNNALVWLFLDGCLPLSDYLKTLEMQVSRLDEFTTLYPGHGPAMESTFIKDQVKCVKAILDGTGEIQPYQSFVGEAKVCKVGNASVAFNPDNL